MSAITGGHTYIEVTLQSAVEVLALEQLLLCHLHGLLQLIESRLQLTESLPGSRELGSLGEGGVVRW